MKSEGAASYYVQKMDLVTKVIKVRFDYKLIAF
jgi:hypothetical protein